MFKHVHLGTPPLSGGPVRLAFDWKVFLLPPTNEVWGKVLLLHLCVILFTRGVGFSACITGHMSRGDLHPGGGSAFGEGLGRPPAKLEKRAVRILLECILVDSVSTYWCILNVCVDFGNLAVLAQHPHVFVRTAHKYRFKAVQCRHLHRPAASDPVVLRQGRPDEHVKLWSEGGAALWGQPVHNPGNQFLLLLPTEGKVMFSEASVSHSVHNQCHGYCVTADPCYSAVGTHPTGMLSCYERYYWLFLLVQR